jgi:nitroreductase
MRDILSVIQRRHTSRFRFEAGRAVAKEDLAKILEAARWAPTAHNMQNFQIIVVDDGNLLDAIGAIERTVSAEFIRENYEQLSFSEEELRRRKVGILGTQFPPSWRTPGKLDEAAAAREARLPLRDALQDSRTLLVVAYDTRRRAPASGGDFLGIVSLGCVLENMWLMAESLGVGFHVLSALGAEGVERKIKVLLDIPEPMRIAFACRLGYPTTDAGQYLRVRREVEDFTHHNGFGKKGLR